MNRGTGVTVGLAFDLRKFLRQAVRDFQRRVGDAQHQLERRALLPGEGGQGGVEIGAVTGV